MRESRLSGTEGERGGNEPLYLDWCCGIIVIVSDKWDCLIATGQKGCAAEAHRLRY